MARFVRIYRQLVGPKWFWVAGERLQTFPKRRAFARNGTVKQRLAAVNIVSPVLKFVAKVLNVPMFQRGGRINIGCLQDAGQQLTFLVDVDKILDQHQTVGHCGVPRACGGRNAFTIRHIQDACMLGQWRASMHRFKDEPGIVDGGGQEKTV